MLKTKQVAYLKSLGHNLQPAVRIGKMGITDEVIESVKSALTANELIKIRILNRTSPIEPKDAIQELAEKLNATLVQVLGHNGLLYKENKKRKNKIELPV